MPELSIIMPLYNTERYVGQAVQSLLSQTYTDFELIIVNDASTDNSLEIASSFLDSRIRIVNNEKNSGIVFSRNKGLQSATGRFIAPFDSDDIAFPDKYQKQICFLQKNPEYGMLGSWIKMIDENGLLLKKKWRFVAKPEQIPAQLLFRNYFAQLSVVILREAIPEGGYVVGFDMAEDYRMWVEIAGRFKVWNYPEYLASYRIHNKSIIKRNEELLNKYLTKVHEYSFNFLNIELNKDLSQLLYLINNDELIKDIEKLKFIEEFLLLIIKQNEKHNIYDHKQLKKVIYNRWLRVCYKARFIPIKMTAQFGVTLLKLIVK